MIITIDYLFADASTQIVKGEGLNDALQAIRDFPWENQLSEDASPEVHFVRRAHADTAPDDIEAYASVLKNDNNTWLIVAGARKPGRLLGLIPVIKKADIVLDELSWQDVSDFLEHFYQDCTGDLFAWMKARDI